MKKVLNNILGIVFAVAVLFFIEPYLENYFNDILNGKEEVSEGETKEYKYPEFVWIEPDIPYKYSIKNFPHIYQNEDYPTGCESVSAVMVLNYFNHDITVDEFIDEYLPKQDIYAEEKDGEEVLYAPNPNEYFVGDPYDEFSLGCYAPVIESAIDDYLDDEWIVENKSGTELKKLIRQYTLNDLPVIFWATMDMEESREGNTWRIIGDEEKEFTWISGEHCLVLIGYDGENYYFSDPSRKDKVTSFPRKTVEKRYKELGMQCVVVEPK